MRGGKLDVSKVSFADTNAWHKIIIYQRSVRSTLWFLKRIYLCVNEKKKYVFIT